MSIQQRYHTRSMVAVGMSESTNTPRNTTNRDVTMTIPALEWYFLCIVAVCGRCRRERVVRMSPSGRPGSFFTRLDHRIGVFQRKHKILLFLTKTTMCCLPQGLTSRATEPTPAMRPTKAQKGPEKGTSGRTRLSVTASSSGPTEKQKP